MENKPNCCPFCGGSKISVIYDDKCFCECINCYARGPLAKIDLMEEECGYFDGAKNEAIELWNRRGGEGKNNDNS